MARRTIGLRAAALLGAYCLAMGVWIGTWVTHQSTGTPRCRSIATSTSSRDDDTSASRNRIAVESTWAVPPMDVKDEGRQEHRLDEAPEKPHPMAADDMNSQLQQPGLDDWASLTPEELAKRRAVNGTIFVVPVNDGYLDFALNLLCSLQRVPVFPGIDASRRRAGTGYVFVAMDPLVYTKLRSMHLPVVKDDAMPVISATTAEWGNSKFHSLVCTKLYPVLRFLRAGLNVVLSDADIAFRSNPLAFVRRDLDLTFSIGSCHKDLPDGTNTDTTGDNASPKLNTGFYFARSSTATIDLFKRALGTCRTAHMTGDQPAMNSVLAQDRRAVGDKQSHGGATAPPAYRYGFFDGCLFANGCIFFKHLCANTTMVDPRPAIAAGDTRTLGKGKVKAHPIPLGTNDVPLGHIRRDDPVLVHANFLVGKGKKIKSLGQYGLWDATCIAAWKTSL